MTLLVTGAWRYTEDELEMLRAKGHELILMPDERAKLPVPAETVEGVICNGLFLYHEIDEFTSLRYIQLTSAGLDRVPLDKIRARGITLRNARGVYSVPMAEYALFGVLSIYKRAGRFAEAQRTASWIKQRDILELCGKSVLIVGCGSVGCECAKRFAAFGCRVSGIDAVPREDALFESVLPVSALEGALAEADVVVLTLPLTPETRHIINERTLACCKRSAVLVNISRGGTVDTVALVSALKCGTLSGAVLDVFEEEPLPDTSPLWSQDGVIITPHNSFVGEGNAHRLSRTILENLEEISNEQ